VDRQTLEREFLALTELEGVSDIEDINRILDRAVTLKNILKSPKRMRRVAESWRTIFGRRPSRWVKGIPGCGGPRSLLPLQGVVR